MKPTGSRWRSTCGSALCGIHFRKGISCEDNSGNSAKDQEVAAAFSAACLFFFFLSFHTSSKPRTVGLLMSKSMCGCGCSIISSLMKRLGRTACCSDLFTSHTSEQLQRLATGCPPQPKVTMRQRPVTQPHLCLHSPWSASCVVFMAYHPCAVQETYGAWLRKAPRVKYSILVHLLCLSETISQVWELHYRGERHSNWFFNRTRWFNGCLAALTTVDLLSASRVI